MATIHTLPLLNNNNDSQKGILDSLRNDTLNVVRLTFTKNIDTIPTITVNLTSVIYKI